MPTKKEALIILTILFFAAGLFFRDNRMVFAAFSLNLLLLADLLVLGEKTRDAAGTLSLTRKADKKIIIRGKSIGIKTDFDLKVPVMTEIVIEDKIPEGSVIKEGSAVSPSLDKPGRYSLNYDLLCLSHGTNRFGGIVFTASNTFFSRRINSHREGTTGPDITVFPSPSFISSAIPSFTGKATDKEKIIKERDVKGHRDYTISDDIRIIDWKVSAKRDKLIAREYSSQTGEIKTIIINLPDSEDPLAQENAELLKGFAGSILMNKEIRNKINIIFISGPNITEIFKPGSSYDEIAAIMNNINPAFRDKYLYRFIPRAYRDSPQKNEFIRALNEKAGVFLDRRNPHLFETQIFNLFSEKDTGEEISVFTLPEKDNSHLSIINEIAEIKQIRTKCFIHKTGDIKAGRSIASCGFSEVRIV